MDIRVKKEPLGTGNKSDFLVLEISGTLPVGSLSNAEVAYWTNWCQNFLDDLQDRGYRPATAVLDMTCLQYRFGDSIGALWLLFMRRKIRPYIVATGDTGTCLKSLIAHSIPVDVVGALEDAYRMIRGD